MSRIVHLDSAIGRSAHGRGLATLASLLLLLMASLLAAAWAQRSSLNEIRSAANQLHSTRAFEAAEAGLAWTQAMLNASQAVGADCQPSLAVDSSSFRSRYLLPADESGRFLPRNSGPAAPPASMACARGAAAWACSCPSGAAPELSAPGTDNMPMFSVQLAAGDRPGSLQVLATGCSHVGRPCLAGADQRADSSSRMKLSLAFLPSLASPPAATLTTRGAIDVGSAALGLHNADALSGGLAVHAGGAIEGAALRISSTPGASTASALLQRDASLAALSEGKFFSRHFGTDLLQWKHQPGVQRLQCAGDCSAALLALIEPHPDIARIAIDGDLRLAGSLQVGSRDKPVVLVVDGRLTLSGPVRLHGLVYAHHMQWDAVAQGEGGLLHGGALLAGGFSGDGAPDLVYDAALMLRLKRQTGTWVRVPGSWRDF